MLNEQEEIVYQNPPAVQLLEKLGTGVLAIWVEKFDKMGKSNAIYTFEHIHGKELYEAKIRFTENHYLVYVHNATSYRRTEILLNAQRDILKMIAMGEGFEKTLKAIYNGFQIAIHQHRLHIYLDLKGLGFYQRYSPDKDGALLPSEMSHEDPLLKEKRPEGYGHVVEIEQDQSHWAIYIQEMEIIAPHKAMLAVELPSQYQLNPFELEAIKSSADLLKIAVTDHLNRKRNQRRVQLLEAHQREIGAMINNTSDYLFSVNESLRLMACNDNFLETFGTQNEPIHIGEPLALPSNPDLEQKLKDYLKKALLDKARLTVEIQTNEPGKEIYELSFNPFEKESGFRGVSVMARDISERKEAEIRLRESEANINALLQNTEDMIFSLDRNFNLLIANSSYRSFCRRLFKKPVEEGKPFDQLQQDPNYEQWIACFKRTLEEDIFSQEFTYRTKRDVTIFEVSFYPILNKLNNIISGISVFARDITSRKKYLQELEQTNFELDSFVYRSSHDLRAPLRSVLGLISLMKMQPTEEERHQYMGLMENSIDKLDRFIYDLTNYSRANRLEIKKEPIDLEHLIESCMEKLSHMENAQQVEIRIDNELEEPLLSDPTRLEIIFQNLLSNAIKYQKGEGQACLIEIHAQEDDEEVVNLCIRDNGLGIPAAELDKIFEMFYRATDKDHGSGLGLYIVKQAVEKLGGKISVESQLHTHTTFTLQLPREQEEGASTLL